jgi:hypothetical protein
MNDRSRPFHDLRGTFLGAFGGAFSILLFFLVSLLPDMAVAIVPFSQAGSEGAIVNATASTSPDLSMLPLLFEEDRGQYSIPGRYYARIAGSVFAFTEDGMYLHDLRSPAAEGGSELAPRQGRQGAAAFVLKFVEPLSSVSIAGGDRQHGAVNYFKGSDRSGWATSVPTFKKLIYTEMQAGIDVVFYGNQRCMEFDFVLRPGADPRNLALHVPGGCRAQLLADGSLALDAGTEALVLRRPVAFQLDESGQRSAIETAYVVSGQEVRILVQEYDLERTLIVDPVLEYGSYWGGSGADVPTDVTVGSDGSIYLCGHTLSSDLPLQSPYQASRGGTFDAFVARLDPAATSLVYCTYLGGSMNDKAYGMAVDAEGAAYIAGHTVSEDFPKLNALYNYEHQETHGFIAKLNPSGNALLFSTHWHSDLSALDLDARTNVYVFGTTYSTKLPLVQAFQAAIQGYNDCTISKLNSQGSSILFSTYLGGSRRDYSGGIDVDGDGNIYLGGYTESTNFPVTTGAFQTEKGEGNWTGSDVFVTAIRSNGVLLGSTYLGGSQADSGFDKYTPDVAVDSEGRIHVTGFAGSSDFPFERPMYTQDDLAFLALLSGDCTQLLFSTTIRGAGQPRGICVDELGNSYVTGRTTLNNLPLVNHIHTFGNPGEKVYVCGVDPDMGEFLYSTYLCPPNGDTAGQAIVLDGSANAFIAGTVSGSNLSPFTNFIGGTTGYPELFVAKISPAVDVSPQIACSTSVLHQVVGTGVTAFAQSLDVWNAGGGTLAYEITAAEDWLQLSPTNGTSSGEKDTIAVGYDSVSLAQGVHTGEIAVSSALAGNSPFLISVFLSVTGAAPRRLPSISVEPGLLWSAGNVGQDAPASTFEVWNGGEGVLEYSLSTETDWMTVSPTSGSSLAEHDVINVSYESAHLSWGTHTGQILVDSINGTNSPVTVHVALHLTSSIPNSVHSVSGQVHYTGSQSGDVHVVAERCPSQGNFALNMDGLLDGFTVAQPSDALQLGSALTMSMWVNFSRQPTQARTTLIQKYSHSTSRIAWLFYYEVGGYFRADFGDGQHHSSSVPGWDTGTWHHVAFTHDGTNGTWFLDGVLDTETPRASVHRYGTNAVYVGVRPWQDFEFPGQMDEIVLWSNSLTQVQIQHYMEHSPEPGSSNLVAFWSFDDGCASDPYFPANDGTMIGNAHTVPAVLPGREFQGSVSSALMTQPGDYSLTDVSNGTCVSVWGFVDADDDGSNDFWEASGLYPENPVAVTGSIGGIDLVLVDPDSDRDGLTDYDEIFHYDSSPHNADTDADVLPDGWEAQHFGHPTNALPGIDGDGDGSVNLDEWIADTVPTNAGSVLRMLRIEPEAGGLKLHWQGGESSRQVIEFRHGVPDAENGWHPMHTNWPPTPLVTNVRYTTGADSMMFRIKASR